MIVNPSASNGELQDQGFQTWHRVMPNDYAEGPAAADWLAKKAKKVIVVSDKSAYGDGVAGAVSKELKAKGVQVINQAADQTSTKDYGPIAQTVKQSGAQALFYAGFLEDPATWVLLAIGATLAAAKPEPAPVR